MKKEDGFTLIETLVAVALIVILSAAGISGWQSWQAQQRLWQTALQARHFLERLREEANWHNQSQVVYSVREGEQWCLLNAPAARWGRSDPSSAQTRCRWCWPRRQRGRRC